MKNSFFFMLLISTLMTFSAWGKTISDSSLLRMSKSVYFKSSLKEWQALQEIAENCVNKSVGALVFNHEVDTSKLKAAMTKLESSDVISEKLDEDSDVEELLFLMRLDLYREAKPSTFSLNMNPSCVGRVLSQYDLGEKAKEITTRLAHFEAILRDRVGVDLKDQFKAPLRRRQQELVISLRDTLKTQYRHEWLLAK